MKQKYELDERQLLNRGIAYQYGFNSAMIIMIVVYPLIDFIELELNISKLGIFSICFWIPMTICLMTMIIKDVYENYAPVRIISIFFGFGGLFMISGGVFHQIMSKWFSLIELKTTAVYEGFFSMGICFLLISVTYWIKQYLNMKKFKNN